MSNLSLAQTAIGLMERGFVPDPLIRAGIRHLCRQRARELRGESDEQVAEFVRSMDEAAVAPVPHLANRQHYEVPASFFELVLGPRRKYSCCYWPAGTESLEQAEVHALQATCDHADLQDGQTILELGCGWGSLSLWMAEQYPASRIVAVSNSRSQRQFIQEQASDRGLSNLRIVTADMNDFHTEDRFDRVVSVEMFEHMRNYRELLRRVRSWLQDDGAVLIHVFCHRETPYPFTVEDATDWMSEHFFSGGMMPSDDLLSRFDDHLQVQESWRWDGRHYQKTAEAWLGNLDQRREQLQPILEATYRDQADKWGQRWRIFFLACAELFGLKRGSEWAVGHYRMAPVDRSR